MNIRKLNHYVGKTLDTLKQEGTHVTTGKIIKKILYRYYGDVCTPVQASAGVEMGNIDAELNGTHSVYMENIVHDNVAPKARAMAFYLPQYHTFPENDEWWGAGFTEWTNTKKSLPRFRNHYQPREPHEDIGYYDLTNPESLKKQAKLAKEHGIFGFCMYYYWFSGKKLMYKPLDLLLEHPEIDINYCLCWANESWTRTWDGQKNNILIEQKYTKDDADRFILDIEKFLKDKRYIRYHGTPVVIVYNPGDIPNVRDVLLAWKEKAREIGIGEISIWICRSFSNSIEGLKLDDIVDKEIEFPPHNMGYDEITNYEFTGGKNDAHVFNYRLLVEYILKHRANTPKDKKLIRTVMFNWDNAARREKGFNSFDGFNLNYYHKWLKENVKEIEQLEPNPEDRYVFINAWNEWAEGTYLEPDAKYGYANLNVTTSALELKTLYMPKVFNTEHSLLAKGNAKIAVQAHIFFADLTNEIIDYINTIPEAFDCYITTDDASKADYMEALFKHRCKAQRVEIALCENKGRDVAPFIMQMQNRALNYDFLLHIHSKKSLHGSMGNVWRRYLFNNLMGTSKNVNDIFTKFRQNEKLGMIYPLNYPPLKDFLEWGSDKEIVRDMFKWLNVEHDLNNELEFPAGNMMWLRPKATYQMFNGQFTWEHFPDEKGQLDGTIMHAIERSWNMILEFNGYTAENHTIFND